MDKLAKCTFIRPPVADDGNKEGAKQGADSHFSWAQANLQNRCDYGTSLQQAMVLGSIASQQPDCIDERTS
jgi:hypothetical protein